MLTALTHLLQVLPLLVSVCSCPIFQGGKNRATITVSVTDASGAAIARARVRIIERSSVSQREVAQSTSAAGTISVELEPQTYNLTVTADNFKSAIIADLDVKAGEQRQIDVVLERRSCPPGSCGDVDPPLIETQRAEPADREIHGPFRLTRISDGIVCPIKHPGCKDRGVRWKDFTILASDGQRLDLQSIPFPTAKRAQKEFQKSIRRAEKILRREPESNSKGEMIGERALAFFAPVREPHASARYYMLFWTWDRSYWAATGEDLNDVLALEAKLREEGTRAVWTWH